MTVHLVGIVETCFMRSWIYVKLHSEDPRDERVALYFFCWCVGFCNRIFERLDNPKSSGGCIPATNSSPPLNGLQPVMRIPNFGFLFFHLRLRERCVCRGCI